MSKSLIEPTLKKYFLNYDPEKVNFSLLNGNLQLKELFFNNKAVNEVFAKSNKPFQLKFGMVTNMHVKISLLGLYIEEVTIEDLILVVSPDASASSQYQQRAFEHDLKEEIWLHLIKNFELQQSGGKMVKFEKTKWMTDKMADEYDKQEKDSINAFAEKGPVQKPPTGSQTTAVESKKMNIMGPELFGIITGRLKFNINIRNIRLYYEDSDNLTRSYGKGSSHISFCLNITEVTLKTVGRSYAGRHRWVHQSRYRQLQRSIQLPELDVYADRVDRTDLLAAVGAAHRSGGLLRQQPNFAAKR